MKKLILAAFLATLSGFARAACDPTTPPTVTTRLGLSEPVINACGWGATTNNNWSIVDSSVVTNSGTNDIRGIIKFDNAGGPVFQNASNNGNSQIYNNGQSGKSELDLYGPNGVGINTTSMYPLNGSVDLAVAGGALGGTTSPYGRFAVIGSSANSSIAYSGFQATSPITQSTLWSLPKADGSANQCLVTDGNAHLSFTTISGGGSGPSGQINAANQYSVPYYSGVSTTILSGLAPGTSGQALITGGSSEAPFWGNVSGSVVLTSSGVAFGSASNTVTSDTNTLTYDDSAHTLAVTGSITASSVTIGNAGVSGPVNINLQANNHANGSVFLNGATTVSGDANIDYYATPGNFTSRLRITNGNIGSGPADKKYKQGWNFEDGNGQVKANISSSAGGGSLTLNATGQILLYDGPTANYSVLKASNTNTNSHIMTLPAGAATSTNSFVNVGSIFGNNENLQFYDLFNGTQTWTGQNTFTSQVTLSTSVVDGLGTTGTSGQVLSSQGAGQPVKWVAQTGGGGGSGAIINTGSLYQTPYVSVNSSNTLSMSSDVMQFPSSVTILGAVPIVSTGTLQSGATIYVSSGNINTLNIQNGASGGQLNLNNASNLNLNLGSIVNLYSSNGSGLGTIQNASSNQNSISITANQGVGINVTPNSSYDLITNKISISTVAATYVSGSTISYSSATFTNLSLTQLNGVTPGLVAGTNITSITGIWPNQTINAATQSGGGGGSGAPVWVSSGSATFETTVSSPNYNTVYDSNTLIVNLLASNTVQVLVSTTGLSAYLLTNSSATSNLLAQSSATATYQPKGNYLTGNQTITVSGDESGSGATAITLTANPVQANIKTFSSSITVANASGLLSTGGINASSWTFTGLASNNCLGTNAAGNAIAGTCSGSGGGIVSPSTFTWTVNYSMNVSSVNISSNAVISGTTFYQGGYAVIPIINTSTLTVTTAALFPGASIYAVNGSSYAYMNSLTVYNGITSSVTLNSNSTGLYVVQVDTTNNKDGIDVLSTGTGHAFYGQAVGRNYGNTNTSAAYVMSCTNDSTQGDCATIYSHQGSQSGNLTPTFQIIEDSSTYDGVSLYIQDYADNPQNGMRIDGYDYACYEAIDTLADGAGPSGSQTSTPPGKFELCSHNRAFFMASRKADNTGFQVQFWVAPSTANGNAVVGPGYVMPVSTLEVAGNMSIGAAYQGISTAPANGLLVQGNAVFNSSVTIAYGVAAGTATFYTTSPSTSALVVMSTNNVAGFSVANSSVTSGDYMLYISSFTGSSSTQSVMTVNTSGVIGMYNGNVFANLGTPANGTFEYCSDCTVTTAATCAANLLSSCVCAGSGTGAIAKRINSTWYCN